MCKIDVKCVILCKTHKKRKKNGEDVVRRAEGSPSYGRVWKKKEKRRRCPAAGQEKIQKRALNRVSALKLQIKSVFENAGCRAAARVK